MDRYMDLLDMELRKYGIIDSMLVDFPPIDAGTPRSKFNCENVNGNLELMQGNIKTELEHNTEVVEFLETPIPYYKQ